jgi:hypothetical protein
MYSFAAHNRDCLCLAIGLPGAELHFGQQERLGSASRMTHLPEPTRLTACPQALEQLLLTPPEPMPAEFLATLPLIATI